ncbi:MAG TPA: ATP-binding protein [Nitrospirota bacterium]|nr:ATP-binding protein [Nitrospirota bacterium]
MMKIRDKLYFAFALYIILAAILGFFSYKEFRDLGTRLSSVETADDISKNVLEVRRYEKNYLLYKDEANRNELQKYISALKETIKPFKSEISREIGENSYAMLLTAIADYEEQVETISADFKAEQELEDTIRSSGRRIEKLLSGNELLAFLVVRRYEKNVMLYRTVEDYQIFVRAVRAAFSPGKSAVNDYASRVGMLYQIYDAQKAANNQLILMAHEIQNFAIKLSRQERADLETAIKKSLTILATAWILVVVVGVVVNIKLGASIATPIRTLEKISQKLSQGDFSEEIAVKGHDELSALQASFNFMESKLKHTMTSLETAVMHLEEKQARLVEAEKLALVGKLAAGIAHEINNPLTSVLTFSNLMLEQCPPGDPRHEKLKLMARETNRARTIVRQLLNFGREITINPVKLNVNQPVREIADSLIAQDAFKGIELELRLAEKLPLVSADPAQIGQVVMNMLLNAIHAVTPPGRIEVSTRRDGRFVDIIFSDSGEGIPEENIHRIFDPFFTTKDSSKGTGLGLAVSYGIIKKHKGDILVASTVGKGTTFTVRLPVHE